MLWVGSDLVCAGVVDLDLLAGGGLPVVDVDLGLGECPAGVGFDAVGFTGEGTQIVWPGLAGFAWGVGHGVVKVEVPGWC